MDDPVDGDDMDDDSANATVIVTDGILTDPTGNTLYVWDKDEAGVSNCHEGCVEKWPPFTGGGGLRSGVKGTVATITRDDGSTQATYDDQPLYYYAADDAPGDRNGDGAGGTWHVVVVGG